MTRCVAIVALVMTIATPGVASAQSWGERMIADRCAACPECCVEIPADLPPSVCLEASPLDKGIRAPCAGILVPPGDAISALRCIGTTLPLLQSSLAKCEGMRLADMKAAKSILAGERLRISQLEQALVNANEALAEGPSLFESPILWGIVGVALVVTAGVLVAVYAVK